MQKFHKIETNIMQKCHKIETLVIDKTDAGLKEVDEYIKQQLELGWNLIYQSEMKENVISNTLNFSLTFIKSYNQRDNEQCDEIDKEINKEFEECKKKLWTK